MNVELEILELRSAIEQLISEVRQLRNEVTGQGTMSPLHWIQPASTEPRPRTLPWPEITCGRTDEIKCEGSNKCIGYLAGTYSWPELK